MEDANYDKKEPLQTFFQQQSWFSGFFKNVVLYYK